MAISKELQNRLKELSEDIDEKSKEKKAAVIGINHTTFSKIYNYGIVPRTPALITIADYFNVSVEYLMGVSDDEYFSKSRNPKKFTERLEELMAENKIKTIYRLSQDVLIHRNNVRQWYTADCLPLFEDLRAMAVYFEVSVDYLLGRTDDRK